jgi:hypothetical protein
MVLAGGGVVAGDEITISIDLELTKPVEEAILAKGGETSA